MYKAANTTLQSSNNKRTPSSTGTPYFILKCLKKKEESTNKTHLILIITFLVLTINKINEFSTPPISSNHTALYSSITLQTMIHIRSQHCALKRIILLHKIKHSHRTLALLLILLSNDINPHPGPIPIPVNPNSTQSPVNPNASTTPEIPVDKPNTEICPVCKNEVNQDEALQCEQCCKWTHIRCANFNNSSPKNDRSFNWICSTQTCNPNYQESFETLNNTASPNRYESLEKVPAPSARMKSRNKSTPHVKQKPQIEISLVIQENCKYDQNLMKELPKISSRDYQGKELCGCCYKEVKINQQAISCDQCTRWIHRSCSDMTRSYYKECQHKNYFPWVCNKCRTVEVQNYDKVELNKLKPEELPDHLTIVKSSDDELLVLHMNCRSAINKQEEIYYIIKITNPDIFCMTETWFDDSIPAQAFIPEGYKIIRKDRSEDFKQKYGKTRGGGVAILYKEHLKVERKPYLTHTVEEILWVHVKTRRSFMLGTVYRSEYTDVHIVENAESTLEENIRKASELSSNLIVVGDFNADTSDPTSKIAEEIKTSYSMYGLNQLITKPTRIDQTSGRPTVIDHVWADTELQLVNTVGTFTGISDHLGTYAKLNIKKPKEESRIVKYRCFKNYNSENYDQELQTNLANSNIQDHIVNKDVNAATEELISIMQITADKHAPIKEVTINPEKVKRSPVPWYTKELEELIIDKNRLISDFCYYGATCFKNRIKSISNSINHLKKKLKKKYLREKLDESDGNPKQSWAILNQITNRQKTDNNAEPEMMNQEKANTANNYFATVGLKILQKLKINIPRSNIQGLQGFSFKPESVSNVEKLIDNIKSEVATGNDNIGAKLLKDAKTTISPYIAEIINIGYEKAIFPDSMKTAIIKPIHKKNDPDDITNYRPISILPTLSKVFERAATDQMVEHLEKNKILNHNQHAYRKGHSTKTCLAEVLNYLYKLVDKKLYAAIVSLDLSKAFDSISHELIIQKLAKMNFAENTLNWVKSYLQNRKQSTKFKRYKSTEVTVSAGVPQGSILGPLLFLCFTNDLPNALQDKCKMVCYADDTQLIVDATNLNQLVAKIEEIITLAQKWYTSNSMLNNIGKTEILIIDRNNINMKNIQIKINDEGKEISLKPLSYIKVLGILIDDKLNWNKQVNRVKKNALNATRNLHRINHLLPIKHRINLYNSLITPHFDYADVVWGGCGKVNSNKLQIVQNFACKSITGNKKYDSATQSLTKLKFLNLQQRRNIHEATFTHKSLLELNPTTINSQYLQQRPTSNTRFSAEQKLNLPQHRTSKFQNSPLYRTIKSWNSCPSHIPTQNTKIFKTTLQKHIIKQTYPTAILKP